MSPSIFGSVDHLESGDSILESERRLWFWRRRSERVDVVRQLVTFCCAHESIWLAWEMISSLRQLCCASSDGSDAHAGGDASEMQLEVSCGRWRCPAAGRAQKGIGRETLILTLSGLTQ
jgi:hypothetical protein